MSHRIINGLSKKMKSRIERSLSRSMLVSFLTVAFIVSGFFAPGALSSTLAQYTVVSGTDSTSGTPTALTAGDVTDLQNANDVRIQSNANWPDDGTYGIPEDNYIEFVFSPAIPLGADVIEVKVTHDWRRGGTLDAAKLKVWDGSTFTDVVITLPSVSNEDITEESNITTILDTPAKVNAAKIQFLAYRTMV